MGPMSENTTPERPRQVTMAAVLAIVFSAMLVLTLFDTLGRLRTPDMRDTVGEFLAEPPGSSLGLEVAQVIDVMRVLAYVSGALAAAALVLAVFVMQRHRGARIGFTVVAALLLLTLPVAGAMPLFLAVAAGLFWTRPARDWYAGRRPAPATPGRGSVPVLSEQGPPPARTPFGTGPGYPGGQPEPPPGQPEQPSGQPTGVGYPPPPGAAAPPWQGSAQEPGQPPAPVEPQGQPAQGQPGQHPGQYGQGPGYPAYPAYPQYPGYGPPGQQADPDARPRTVVVAAVLTWVGGGAVTLMMLLFAALLATNGDAFVDEFDRAARGSDVNLSADEIVAIGWGVAGVFLVWSLIGIVLGVLAFRRSNAGRYALAASAAMACLVSLLAILSLVSLVTLLMAGATLVLLFTGGANEWYRGAGRSRGRGGYPGGPGYPSGPAQGYPQSYPQGYPQSGPQDYPQSGPQDYPQGGPQGYPQSGPQDYPQGSPPQQERPKPW
jgi:hypothetical protein